jgi:hypothetical protein
MFGRQVSVWLLVLAQIVSAAAFGQASRHSGGRIKWNPGHYMASASILRGPGDLNKLNHEMSALRNHPGIVGYRVLTTWSAIEKSRGEYDFSLLDQVMKTLKTGLDTPKHLVVVILPGTFSGTDPDPNDGSYLPEYLQQDDAYGSSPRSGSHGWWHHPPSGGYCAAMHRQAVMDRFIALMQAVGAHFDGDPNFEAIMVQEDAWMAQRINKAPDFSADAFTAQLKRLLTAMTAAFPNTSVVMQATWNGSKANSTDFEQWLVANRIAPSSADTIGQSAIDKSSNILAWGVQAYAFGGKLDDGTAVADLRPQASAMMDVEAFDMVGDYYAKSGGPFSPQDLLQALNETYHASHAFWTYLTGKETYHGGKVPAAAKWSNLAAFLEDNPLKRTAYPANYP